MILLNGQSLTPARKLMPEALGLSLEERRSTATMELGPADPEVPVGSWLLDDEPGTGEGIVWRTRSADTNFNTETRNITLEHIISTLQDDVLFGEHTWEDIAGAGASDCSAKQAAEYILARQSLWVLGDFEFTERWPYKFNGDSLFSALQTVTASCPDAYWEYDLSRIPFRLHVRRISDETTCEMRPGRNIRTIKRVIDRSGMYTRHYPIGKDDLHITGDYISKNEAIYGKVCKIETYSGAETEDALRSWAWERLNRHCEPKVTVTIGGLELSEATGESLDKLTLNRRCRVPLPEFGTTITERIIRIRVTDKVRKKEEVTVTLGNEIPDLAAIVGEVEKEQASGSGGGGRGGMKQAGEDHAWFVDTDEHVGMVAEAIIGHGPDGVDWSRVAEVIVDGNGIHNRVTRAEGYLVVMEAKIDLTEEKLRAEFTDVTASLRSELEMSAASLRVEFENLNNSTRSELLITSESLRTEFTNEINSTRSELQITSESLRTEFTNLNNSTRSELQITSESLRTEFTNLNNGTRSELQITSESLRSTIENTAEGLQSQIDQTAESIRLKVSKGDVMTQLAVEAGNVSISGGNLVVDGYITSSGLASEIANISVMQVQAIALSGGLSSASGDIRTGGTVAGANLYRGSTDMGNAFVAVTDPGYTDNEKTITFTKANGNTEAITFSRAIDPNPDWSWINGHASVTLQPQNQTFTSPSAMGVTADTANHTVKAAVGGDASLAITCEKVSVVYSPANHNYAYVFQSKAGTSVVASTSGTTNTDAYDAGVAAGEGKFTLASVTLQGTGGYVTAINANAGLKVKSAVKYNAGSGYTLYEAGSSFSYNDVGSTTVYTRSNRMALKYVGTISGQTGVFYKVDASGTNYYQTSEYTPTKRTGTRIGSQVTGTNLGSQVAVYVSASDGTQYYQAGATSYLYSAGSTVSNKYYTKDT